MPNKPPIACEIEAYDRSRHEGFVLSSWSAGGRHDRQYMLRRLADPATVCVVAKMPDNPEGCNNCGLDHGACICGDHERDVLWGWCATVPHENSLLWVYVKSLYGELRRRGIGRALMLRAGLDFGNPIPCPFWSPSGANMAAGRIPLIHAPTPESRAASCLTLDGV